MREGMSLEDTAVYILMLEQLCENQQVLCEANEELIGCLEEKIEEKEQIIFRQQKIQKLQADQLKMAQDLVTLYKEESKKGVMGWLKRCLG